ncbi:MAG: hypothetical protein JW904_01055 [Spirochaetales bacterium]|nr:hypothetical protein [Spirochaetales bacterium]
MKNKAYFLLFSGVTLFTAIPSFNFPDMDISLLGIENHRFFLFHSVLIPLVLYYFLRTLPVSLFSRFAGMICAGFFLGISIHLATDIIPQKAVNFLFTRTLVYGTYWDDRIWIIANMFAGFFLVFFIYKEMRTKYIS